MDIDNGKCLIPQEPFYNLYLSMARYALQSAWCRPAPVIQRADGIKNHLRHKDSETMPISEMMPRVPAGR